MTKGVILPGMLNIYTIYLIYYVSNCMWSLSERKIWGYDWYDMIWYEAGTIAMNFFHNSLVWKGCGKVCSRSLVLVFTCNFQLHCLSTICTEIYHLQLPKTSWPLSHKCFWKGNVMPNNNFSIFLTTCFFHSNWFTKWIMKS